jgi:hypothetical protein
VASVTEPPIVILWKLSESRSQFVSRWIGFFVVGFTSNLVLFGLANFGAWIFCDLDWYFGLGDEAPDDVFGFPLVFLRREPGYLSRFNLGFLTADILITLTFGIAIGFALAKFKAGTNLESTT